LTCVANFNSLYRIVSVIQVFTYLYHKTEVSSMGTNQDYNMCSKWTHVCSQTHHCQTAYLMILWFKRCHSLTWCWLWWSTLLILVYSSLICAACTRLCSQLD